MYKTLFLMNIAQILEKQNFIEFATDF